MAREMVWQFLADYKDWITMGYLAIMVVAGTQAIVKQDDQRL